MLMLRSWWKFLISSGIAASISILMFEAASSLVDVSRIGWHVGSVAVAYLAAARVNCELQYRWVFAKTCGRSSRLPFHRFVAGNGVMSLLVGMLSALIADWPMLVRFAGPTAPLLSLVLAAAGVAPLSFLLMRRLNGGSAIQGVPEECVR